MKKLNPSRILVLATPGIGDALLATPLVRSVRQAYPRAEIDMLVREGRSGVLHSNPDISRVLTLARRPGLFSSLRFLWQIFRRYDLAVSTSMTDRSFAICFFASSKRVMMVPPLRLKDWWKYFGATRKVFWDPNTNIVVQNLRLADAMGIDRLYDVVLPEDRTASDRLDALLPFAWRSQPYVVIHMLPIPVYKRWPKESWSQLIAELSDCGLRVVLTGGPDCEEVSYVQDVAGKAPDSVFELAGQLSFEEVTELIRQARLYLGPDTSTTHLAAATGTPTVGIYGPTNVQKWGPWPCGLREDTNVFNGDERVQQCGNVLLIRANCNCVPYQNQCLHLNGEAAPCLAQLSVGQVFSCIQQFISFDESHTYAQNA